MRSRAVCTGANSTGIRPSLRIQTCIHPVNPIDHHVLKVLQSKASPRSLVQRSGFIRRVFLDVIGTLPTTDEATAFQDDSNPDKRARLIDTLLERPEFNDYWAMKWCDILRVKSEHPINLWPNGVQAYHQWIRHSLAADMPYDQMARLMLTSSGSSFRVPQVNFYRAVQGQNPTSIAAAVALTFMGTRLETWQPQDSTNLEKFFSQVTYKATAEWKEQIVLNNPAPRQAIKSKFPDGKTVVIADGNDPRVVFADWLIGEDNPWFARCISNRIWAWLLGRGIIHEPDDIRPDNPPVNPALLEYLEKELVKSNYSLKHLYRLILNSRTYQQSSIARGDSAQATQYFAVYGIRPMEAEVLTDALIALFGTTVEYESPIPEPFTYIPPTQRTVALADASISSAFLELFGRPSRDTGLMSERSIQPTDAQRMYLLNASQIQNRLTSSTQLRRWTQPVKGKPNQWVDNIYQAMLSRKATNAEIAAINNYIKQAKTSTRDASLDLAWAIINSKEFQYKH
ncbi:MAG: DUF1553 domain-containing protein [Phycisphaerales bacterium]|nr:DUF1553 domain-containing protein [Phycisphaerales bacterium]